LHDAQLSRNNWRNQGVVMLAKLAAWKDGLSGRQIALVLAVFWFTAIGAWLTVLGCRRWNRRRKRLAAQTITETVSAA